MEERGIINSKIDTEKKSKIIYSPTEKGIDLISVLVEIIKWSGKYDENCITSGNILQRVNTDKESLIAELSAELRKNIS